MEKYNKYNKYKLMIIRLLINLILPDDEIVVYIII